MRQVGEGGIFAALYRLAKEADTGLVVDLKAMPVRQETIEICEYYKLNPYQLASTGNILMICDDGGSTGRCASKRGDRGGCDRTPYG